VLSHGAAGHCCQQIRLHPSPKDHTMSPLTDPPGPDLKATLRALKLGKPSAWPRSPVSWAARLHADMTV